MILFCYLFVALGLLVFGMRNVSREPTAHGQAVLLSMLLVFALLWPLALAWIGIVGLALAARRAWARLRSLWG